MANSVGQGKDYSIFLCYDQRQNADAERVIKFLLEDLRLEEKNAFLFRLIE